jgi:hypothetical protein
MAAVSDIELVIADSVRNRRGDVSDDVLVRLGEANKVPHKWRGEFPVFSSEEWDWHSPTGLPSQIQYDAIFEEQWQGVADMLRRLNQHGRHFVVAGGAAAGPFSGKSGNDLDIFIVGANPDSKQGLTDMLDRVAGEIGSLTIGSGKYADCAIEERVLTPGVFTSQVYEDIDGGWHAAGKKYQVMLRVYKTVAAVLHGFDVPSCSVAYDGTTTVMTLEGCFCQHNLVNIVAPERRSPSYELRLKKYFDRGYALVLPRLNPRAFCLGKGVVKLGLEPYPITLEYTSWFLHRAVGTIKAASDAPESDYDYFTAVELNLNLDKSHLRNIAALRHKDPRKYTSVHNSELESQSFGGVSIGTYAANPTTIGELLRSDEMALAFDIMSMHTSIMSPRRLILTLGVTVEEVVKLAGAVVRLLASSNQNVSIRQELSRFITPIIEEYDRVRDTPFTWWITQEPEKQHTSSHHPLPATDAEWYGPHLTSGKITFANLWQFCKDIMVQHRHVEARVDWTAAD